MIQEFFTAVSEVCNECKVILGPEAVETLQLELGAGETFEEPRQLKMKGRCYEINGLHLTASQGRTDSN